MRRGKDLKRRRARLDVRPRILIVCEGRVTEPEYINLIRVKEKINLVRIVVDNQGGTPKTLVDRAVAEKRKNKSEYGKQDEIWCVFDIDEHPLIAEAKQKGRCKRDQISNLKPMLRILAAASFCLSQCSNFSSRSAAAMRNKNGWLPKAHSG